MVLNELMVLLWLTVGLVGVLTVLFVYLIIRKLLENRVSRNISQQKALLAPLLREAMLNGRDLVVADQTYTFRQALEELLKEYTDVLGGEREQEIVSNMADQYLHTYYQQSLRGRRWSKRMNALYHIEDFHLRSLEGEVFTLLEKKSLSREELVVALRILASNGYQDLFVLLQEQVMPLTDFEYRGILLKLGDEDFRSFLSHFESSRESLQWAVLEVIASKRDGTYLSFLEKIVQTYQGETRLRALKAIVAIGFTNHLQQFCDFAKSDRWQERMIVAKLIGTMQATEYGGLLEELLHDRNWWVRQQAGHSLLHIPNGTFILTRVAERSNDLYAQDMARECLNEEMFAN